MTSALQRSRRRRRWWRIALIGALLIVLVVGCGRQVAPYWPTLVVEGTGDDATLYVAQTDGRIYSLEGDTGTVTWVYAAYEEEGGLLSSCSPRQLKDGPFFSPPGFSEESLYLSSAGDPPRGWRQRVNKTGLRVLNRAGTLQWEFRESKDRSISPPAVDDTTVYLPSSDHSVYAIDLGTRKVRWPFATENWVWASPLVVGDRVYIASMDHSLYAVDKASGTQLWKFTGQPGALASSPVISEGRDQDQVLYFGSLGGHVYAVQAETGALEWETKVDGGIWSSPLLVTDEQSGFSSLYVGTLNGLFYALDPQDGSELWTQEVAGEIRGTAAYVGAPTLPDAQVYVGCAAPSSRENGELYAFDAQTGVKSLFSLGQQDNGVSLYASPVFDGQSLYVVASDGRVFALDLESNEIMWQKNPLEQN